MLSRRDFLSQSANGFGAIALSWLLGQDRVLASTPTKPSPKAELNGGLHHQAKAKRVVQFFMSGAASQCDTFDYKPELIKRHGQKFEPEGKIELFQSNPGSVMKSPWTWKQYGKCGKWVSSLLPNIAECVDDICFLPAMTSKSNVHGPATFFQATGFVSPGFPGMGAWICYGLGRLTDNLPAFVVLPDSRGFAPNGPANWSSGFLPAEFQGTIVKPNSETPIFDLFPPAKSGITKESEIDGMKLLEKLNRQHLRDHPGDSRLEARIASYELAAKMQLAAPEVLDLSKETESTKKMYGLDRKDTEELGRNCLIARRLLERGVRLVQIWSGADNGFPRRNWDSHEDIAKDHGDMGRSMDRPTAALLKDLIRFSIGPPNLDGCLVVRETKAAITILIPLLVGSRAVGSKVG
jgi:hypothetical protein